MTYGKQTRRNLFLPDAMVDELKRIAAKSDIPYSELIRRILSVHIERMRSKEIANNDR